MSPAKIRWAVARGLGLNWKSVKLRNDLKQVRPDLKPLLDQILCEVPATKEINIFFILCSPIHPWSRNLPAGQFPEQHLNENGIYNRHPVQIIFSAAPKANPAKLLGSVGFSARVNQDIRQLETPLVFSLDNCYSPHCRIFNMSSLSPFPGVVFKALSPYQLPQQPFLVLPPRLPLVQPIWANMFRSWCRWQKIPIKYLL